MLTYKLIESNKDGYVYEYYPEGDKSTPGKIMLSKNGDNIVIKESDKDSGRRYANHAIKGIDVSKNSGTVAWY